MFDTYTTSNAESEHAALKKDSLGVRSNGTMTFLAQKATSDSLKQSSHRVIFQNNDLQRTDTTTKCDLSNYLVKPCFNEISKRLKLATRCISKQVNKSKWIVYYKRNNVMYDQLHMHYIPIIWRQRHVILTSGK